MPDKANARSRRRPAQRAETSSEVVELRAQLAGQAESIGELRREVGWLTEELIAKNTGVTDDAATDGERDASVLSRATFHGIRRLVHEHVPHGSRIVVASSGDDGLLRYAGYRAEHLSQHRSGAYVGSHPSSSRAAVVQVEAARWRGADALLIPAFQLWWIEHYPQFARHLERHYACVTREQEVGAIWDLRNAGSSRDVHDLLARLCVGLDRQAVILDWHTGKDLAACLDDYKVVSPVGDTPDLPYLEGTIDVVAVAETDVEKVAEARRVATAAVISVGEGEPPAMKVLSQFELADEQSPSVSIVVASADGQASTPDFTRGLLGTLPVSFTGEVVIDAACDSAVPQLGPEAKRLKRIKTFRCPEGEEYQARVRRGAEAASGDVLVVLEGSTWPIPGWLEPLVRLLDDVSEAGVVTGMVVEPDGCSIDRRSLLGGGAHQSAGRARDDQLDAPRHSCVRRLDATPDEFFATHRQLFLEWNLPQQAGEGLAGGFCRHVRSSGLSVLYQPETAAISSRRGEASPTEMGGPR